MQIPKQMVKPARVLHEDDDFVTVEVGKHDDVSFTLEDGDEFLTLLFIRSDGEGGMEVWEPWADG